LPSLQVRIQLLNKRSFWEVMDVQDGKARASDMDLTILPTNLLLVKREKNPLCPSNANGWQVVNQPLAGASASAVGKRSLTDSEADLFNETVAFLEAQISTAKSAGLEGQDALEFIATAECQNTPPLEITPVLEAWIKMNQGNISSYDRICDNSSARFCAAFPDSELCLEEEWEEEAEALIIVDRTLEVVAIAEGVIIVILLIFSIVSCIKQQGVVRVDDSYVTMGAQKF